MKRGLWLDGNCCSGILRRRAGGVSVCYGLMGIVALVYSPAPRRNRRGRYGLMGIVALVYCEAVEELETKCYGLMGIVALVYYVFPLRRAYFSYGLMGIVALVYFSRTRGFRDEAMA